MTSTRAAAAPGFDRRAAVTRSLLGYGVLVGPFYLAVGLIQAFVRDGFDLGRHPLSILANGPGGWVQTANFGLSGAMVAVASVGIGRVLGKGSQVATTLLALFGLSMLVAAGFRADPVDGFPPGTPLGPPASISTMGLVHFAAGGLGFTALGLSGLFAARPLARSGARRPAVLSFAAGLVVLATFFGGFAVSQAGILGIWISVVVGWAWLAGLSLWLYRVAPDPNC